MAIVNLKAKKFFIFVISLIIIHFSFGLKIKKVKFDISNIQPKLVLQPITVSYSCTASDYSKGFRLDSCNLSNVKTLTLEPYMKATIKHINGYTIEVTNGKNQEWKVPLNTYLNLYKNIRSIVAEKIEITKELRSSPYQNIKISNVHVASKLGNHKVLDIKDKKTNKNGANVQLYDQENQGNQRWNVNIIFSANNAISISNVEHGKQLARNKNTAGNNVNIEINGSCNLSRREFKLIHYSEKYFYIAAADNTNYVLHISGNKDKNKQNIILYKRKSSYNDNQLWYFEYS